MVKKRTRRASAGDPTKAVAYIRCSTCRQDLSPEAQRTAIKRWAAEHDVTVVEVHEDIGKSGGSDIEERPGLVSAIEAVAQHRAGLFIVAKRDRVARAVAIAALVEREVHRRGGRLVSADGNGNGDGFADEMVKVMSDVMGGWERRLIRERTKAALAVKKAQGLRVGGIPLGYHLADDGKTLVKDRGEQRAIRTAVKLCADGLSYRDVAERLDEMGIATRTGRAWDPTPRRRCAGW